MQCSYVSNLLHSKRVLQLGMDFDNNEVEMLTYSCHTTIDLK